MIGIYLLKKTGAIRFRVLVAHQTPNNGPAQELYKLCAEHQMCYFELL